MRSIDYASPSTGSRSVAAIGPNWYAVVMGTGIVATAGATLSASSLVPQIPGLRSAATVVWLLAAVFLVLISVATALHWIHHRTTALGHLDDPVMAHFYGAPPMALLTVGAGTLLLGRDLLGVELAVRIDVILWLLGTALGLISAIVVPYKMITRHRITSESPFGGWLMSVVPPMVSAATGALLIEHIASAELRRDLLLACYSFFGLSLITAMIIYGMILLRLVQHGVGQAKMVPTLWIGLGPLGQSITAANLLGTHAGAAVATEVATMLHYFGIVFGLPVLGFAAWWGGLSMIMTIRTLRQGLPFSMTWWSFTFPVGTCVTGLAALASATGSRALGLAALSLYALLCVAWLVVATRTLHGSLITGSLLLPAAHKRPAPSEREPAFG